MAQKVETSNSVIVTSLYIMGELGVGETPDSFMLSTGLDILNSIINEFSANNISIPYKTDLNFNFTSGQASYTISTDGTQDIVGDKLITIEFANYTLDDLVYPIKVIPESIYKTNKILNTYQARPANVWLDHQAAESTITFYPAPDQPYACSLRVWSMLNEIDSHDTLNNLPPYFVEYLKYETALRFLSYYPSHDWKPQTERVYQRLKQLVEGSNTLDVAVEPSDVLITRVPSYWPAIVVG